MGSSSLIIRASSVLVLRDRLPTVGIRATLPTPPTPPPSWAAHHLLPGGGGGEPARPRDSSNPQRRGAGTQKARVRGGGQGRAGADRQVQVRQGGAAYPGMRAGGT
jgi:hypothetical protein